MEYSFLDYSWCFEGTKKKGGERRIIYWLGYHRNQYSIHARATRVDFDDIESNDRESVEFTALDRDRGLDESFLDDEDSDIEQNRI
jgi:hypothetical protein